MARIPPLNEFDPLAGTKDTGIAHLEVFFAGPVPDLWKW
jgi:hypothetical protein